jgi:glycine oxidase
MEHVGFAREVTVSGLASMLTRTARVIPALDRASVTGFWSSFRPGTKDGLPLIGALGPRGLYVASGHHRNGILLSALTAELVCDLVLGVPRTELDALDPQRFEAR